MKVPKTLPFLFIHSLLLVLVLIALNCDSNIQNQEMLRLTARSYGAGEKESDLDHVVMKKILWKPQQTAAVICDMWDQHWCAGAARRVKEMAPQLNQLVRELRNRGVLIIHAPSATMDFYKGTSQRRLAQGAPEVETSVPLQEWCYLDENREPPLPIDDSDEGCDCDPRCVFHRPWTRQIETIEISLKDAITDNEEAFYLMKQYGIKNVLIMGVHANFCVLGRPFGVRQLVKQGQNVLLIRDLTDSLYNPEMKPYVDHFTGTDLVINHIETYWCPTITSDQIIGDSPFRFNEDKRSL